MEFPSLGQHCSEKTCNLLDFLPMKCDACGKIYCKDHVQYSTHQCPDSYKKDVQVPVCPLCNQPVPVKRGEAPDIRVGEHIDRDCQADPAVAKRKVFTNKCSQKGCKQKEVVRITCDGCYLNYCLRHRHQQDHNCSGPGKKGEAASRAGAAALSRFAPSSTLVPSSNAAKSRVSQTAPSNPRSTSNPRVPAVSSAAIQGNLDDDEAFARAVQLSMMDVNSSNGDNTNVALSQEDEDLMLARALSASEQEQTTRQNKNRCFLS